VLAPRSSDPDLARVAAAWPALPAPIRAAVLALVAAATPALAQDAAGGAEAAAGPTRTTEGA
jgi:hypothetical protein